ncbi:hypothetical protein M404DRAFT_1001265 [Pisolithus tinctorius Marx 270]|uniref:Uncharacterized protein n=1 Tax=Pisolithus tinctorius Marx 270 TaxID=870435 RepID=A0A0C3NR80_PISTI|nr:hypothetical protein M404DRAFT_1001265 [Pisolithus tinctorius Marx 270]
MCFEADRGNVKGPTSKVLEWHSIVSGWEGLQVLVRSRSFGPTYSHLNDMLHQQAS